MQPHPLLRRHRPRRVGVELVLVHGEQRGVHMVDAVRTEQPSTPVGEQPGLLLVRHGERIDLVRGHPRPVLVHRLGGQLHSLVRTRGLDHLCRQLRHRDGLRRHLRGRVHRQIHARREAPCAAVYDAHRVPEVRGVRRARGPRVPQPPLRAAHPLHAEVRVVGAESPRAGQRGIGEGPQRQRREGFIDRMGHGCSPCCRRRCRQSCQEPRAPAAPGYGHRSAPIMSRRRAPRPHFSVGTRQRLSGATVGGRFSVSRAVPIGFRGTRPLSKG